MHVAVIGTGYVGLVTGACLAAVGHRVTCVDSDRERAATVARGDCPIHEKDLPRLVREGVAAGRLAATTDLAAAVHGAEVVMIAVGTPSVDGRLDLSGVETAAEQLGSVLKGAAAFPVVTVKSTVLPGTTDGLVRRTLEKATGLRAGEGFGLAMNPEFLSQGSAVADFMEPDRIVVGAFDPRTAEVMADLYRPFPAPLLAMGLREAEMSKYAANALQATLISFANEIASVCEATEGIDHRKVMEAVHMARMLDGPGGGRAGATAFLMGGVGFGGSCFPKDLEALADHARRVGAEHAITDAVQAVNFARADRVLDLLTEVVGDLWQKRIAVLGLAFKPHTDDLRDSPGLRLAKRLLARGAEVRAHDPLPLARQRARAFLPVGITIAETADATLAEADAAILVTAWPDYRGWDWAGLASRMNTPVVMDGRGLLAGLDLPRWLNVVPIGAKPPQD